MDERQDIFEMLGRNSRAYHSAILTTYAFDPIFFSSYYLRHLYACGIVNIILIVDSSQYDVMMNNVHRYADCMDILSSVTIIRRNSRSSGVFHPKVSFLFGEKQGLLLTGSGNLTYAGILNNEEVWGIFHCDGENTTHTAVCSAAWRYLQSLVPEEMVLAQQQLKWIRDYSQWISSVSEYTSLFDALDKDETVSFLANTSEGHIFEQVSGILGKTAVKTIKILSPFYDKSGKAISELINRFHPSSVKCIVNDITGTLPSDFSDEGAAKVSFIKWSEVASPEKKIVPNLHAKMIQFETEDGTAALLGSANSTYNALFGHNDEACLFLRSPDGKDYFKSLGVSFKNPGVSITAVPVPALRKKDTGTTGVNHAIQIISAELVGEKLTLSFNQEVKDLHVALLPFTAAPGSVKDKITVSGKTVIEKLCHTVDVAVALDETGKEISNRYLILKEEKVVRANPNRKTRELESLLGSSVDWDRDLIKVLSFIKLDQKAPIVLKAASSKVKDNSSDLSQPATITRDQFDDVSKISSVSLANQPNTMIADHLRRMILSSVDYEESPDDTTIDDLEGDGSLKETSSQETPEKTNAGDRSEVLKARTERTKEILKLLNSIDRKVYKPHFDLYSDPLAVMSGVYKDRPIKKKHGREDTTIEKPHISINDVSIAVIGTTLTFQYCIEDPQTASQVRPIFCKNLGAFLLYSRKRQPVSDDYTGKRMLELFTDLYVLSLCCLAHFAWLGKEIRTLQMLVLNIIDAVAQAPDMSVDNLENAFGDYILKAKAKIDILSETVAQIAELFKIYRALDLKDPSGSVSIKSSVDPIIVYRTSLGFVEVSDFSHVKGDHYIDKICFKLSNPGLADRDIRPPVVMKFRKIVL